MRMAGRSPATAFTKQTSDSAAMTARCPVKTDSTLPPSHQANGQSQNLVDVIANEVLNLKFEKAHTTQSPILQMVA
jgi:hypothetical protein